jgi:hypothetical protein
MAPKEERSRLAGANGGMTVLPGGNVVMPAMVERNKASSGFARSRWTDEGEMGREWEAEELQPCTPANGAMADNGGEMPKAGSTWLNW